MQYSILESCWFMEVWLSPMVGFDYLHAKATIYGDGTKPLSWVSSIEMGSLLARVPIKLTTVRDYAQHVIAAVPAMTA